MNNLVPLFLGLADESRLRILSLLFASGELCVCDIQSTLRFTQTKVSRHMKYLKRTGLVQTRPKGKWMLSRIYTQQNDELRIIIRGVKNILEFHLQAKKDRSTLVRRYNEGCCSTFAFLKPDKREINTKSTIKQIKTYL